MTTTSLTRAGSPSAKPSTDVDGLIRGALFVAALLVIWISLEPFRSLAERPPEVADGGNRANQIVFTLIFLSLGAWAYRYGLHRWKPIVRPAMVLTLAWFALSVVTSWEPALAARRLVFALMVVAIAAVLLLLPRTVRHFADLLVAAVLIVLALCYLGVLLTPSVAVHQATDFLEPEHAGSWRGVFPHKNEAGAIMVVFIMIGLFIARIRNVALGGLIGALAAVFLWFTHSKTSIGLLPLTLIVSAVVTRLRRPAWALILVVGTVGLFNLLTVGSVYFESVGSFLDQVLPDASFTGRTDIWKFALEELARRPITGFGFSSFWGTENVVFGLGQMGTWASAATDAHNAYLNLALTVGVPGLLLAVGWLVVLPLMDFYRRPADPQSRALSILFLQVWLFGLFASSFESILFSQVGEVWIMFLIAVFGLRYLTMAPVNGRPDLTATANGRHHPVR